MTFLESCFNDEMEVARRMRCTGHDYWAGYSIGLRSSYFEGTVVPPAV